MGSPKVKIKPDLVIKRGFAGKNASTLSFLSPNLSTPTGSVLNQRALQLGDENILAKPGVKVTLGSANGKSPLVQGQAMLNPKSPVLIDQKQLLLVNSKPSQNVSWASLFKANKSDVKSFSSFELLSSIKSSSSDFVEFNESELQDLRQPWFSSLIGRFVRRSLPHFHVHDWAMAIWSMFNLANVIDMQNGFFLFHFFSEEDAVKVLTNGPWDFRGDLINLRPWKPDFKALTEEISSAPVWIQFPDLPMEYWHDSSLFKIASAVGKPIKVDDNSFNWQRGKFVHVCVELDFNKPLKQGIWIGKPNIGLFQAIRYERLLVFCFKCGIIDHHIKDCIAKSASLSDLEKNDRNNTSTEQGSSGDSAKLVDNPLAKISSSDTSIYGPWIKVGRKGRSINRPRFVDPDDKPASLMPSIPDYGRNSHVANSKDLHLKGLEESSETGFANAILTNPDKPKASSSFGSLVNQPRKSRFAKTEISKNLAKLDNIMQTKKKKKSRKDNVQLKSELDLLVNAIRIKFGVYAPIDSSNSMHPSASETVNIVTHMHVAKSDLNRNNIHINDHEDS
ncbi:hypothetical protein Cni_G06290 [Canna indica]|uniref:CCHC-type domain-containing protein n=1 Tax=Canna indica TaxID=4628 RepID=A0AAQ3Q667_9LILI|nr:hypothetical protein Cni_G06290 [Canna indica]